MGLFDFFSRRMIHTRERPTSSDLNRMQEYAEAGLRRIQAGAMGSALSGLPSTDYGVQQNAVGPIGFYGTGFMVASTGAFGIGVLSGVGCGSLGPASAVDIGGVSGLNWTADTLIGAPLALSVPQALTVPPPPIVGSSRIDIIEVRPNYQSSDPATVGIFNAATRIFDPTVKNKRFNWDLLGLTGSAAPGASTAAISYVTGVAVVGGIAAAVEPAVTPGYIMIGRINLDGAVAAITQDLIADMRPKIYAGGMIHAGAVVNVPGTAVGLGTQAITNVELPPGVVMTMGYINNVPPAVGTSYTMEVYLFGGEIRPRTSMATRRGTATVTAGDTTIFCAGQIRDWRTSAVDTTLRSMLAGTTGTYTVVTPRTFAIGQPYVMFAFELQNTSAGAIGATEQAFLQFMMGQG